MAVSRLFDTLRLVMYELRLVMYELRIKSEMFQSICSSIVKSVANAVIRRMPNQCRHAHAPCDHMTELAALAEPADDIDID